MLSGCSTDDDLKHLTLINRDCLWHHKVVTNYSCLRKGSHFCTCFSKVKYLSFYFHRIHLVFHCQALILWQIIRFVDNKICNTVLFQIYSMWLDKLQASYFLVEQVQLRPWDSALCTVGNNLVVRGMTHGGEATFNVLNLRSLGLVNRWSLPCLHSSEEGISLPLVSYESSGTKYILEGCAACEVIRIYDVKTGELHEAYEGIQPYQICAGPAETIFVLDGNSKKVLQLTPSPYLTLKFNFVVKSMAFDMHIVGMKYFDNCDVIVLAGAEPPKLMGIKTTERGYKVLWQYVHEVQGIPLNPTDVAITHPTKLVCVANIDGVLVLNPSDGSFVQTKLLEEDKVQSVEWTNDNLITSQTDGLLSVYKYEL